MLNNGEINSLKYSSMELNLNENKEEALENQEGTHIKIKRTDISPTGTHLISSQSFSQEKIEKAVGTIPIMKKRKQKDLKDLNSLQGDSVQISEVKKIEKKSFFNPVNYLVYPLNTHKTTKKEMPKSFQRLRANQIDIPVNREDGDSHYLEAFSFPAARQKCFDPTQPVVVLFHPNASTCKNMHKHVKTYVDNGYQALTVTMGGYPDSDHEINTSEISSCQDANAVIEYLKSLGAKNIIVHGTSIGGTLAFAAAELHPETIKVVIADQTFSKIDKVATNLIKNHLGILTPTPIIKSLVNREFPKNKIVPGVFKNGVPYTTDGLNNARKASVIQSELLIIKSKDDFMMGVKGKHSADPSANLADELIDQRYHSIEEANNKVFEIEGDHCTWFTDSIKEMQFVTHLQRILHPKSKD